MKKCFDYFIVEECEGKNCPDYDSCYTAMIWETIAPFTGDKNNPICLICGNPIDENKLGKVSFSFGYGSAFDENNNLTAFVCDKCVDENKHRICR